MARKMNPMTVLNVPPITGRPEAGMRFVISLLITRNASAPIQAPSIRRSPPMTAMTSSWIVASSPMIVGESCPNHHA